MTTITQISVENKTRFAVSTPSSEKADKKLIALLEKYHVDEVKAVSVQDVKNAFKPVKKYFKELVFSKKVTQADFDLVAPFFTNAKHQGLLIQFPRFTRDKEWIAAFFKDYDDLCDSDLYEFRSLKLACDFILSKMADRSAPDYAHAKPHRTQIMQRGNREVPENTVVEKIIKREYFGKLTQHEMNECEDDDVGCYSNETLFVVAHSKIGLQVL